MQKSKKTITITVIVIIVILIIIFISRKMVLLGQDADAAVEVSTYEVAKQTVISTVEADGEVVFKDTISVYSESTGKIQTLSIKEGDSVTSDSTILTYSSDSLDSLKRQLEEAKLSLQSAKLSLESLYIPTETVQITQLETQILQTETSIAEYETNLNSVEDKIIKATTDYENAKKLYDQGAISLKELESYEDSLTSLEEQAQSIENSITVAKNQLEYNKQQLESAQNSVTEASNQNRIETQKVAVQQAELKISQLQEDINKFKTEITSPASGIVTNVYVTEGSTVQEGTLIAEIGTDELIIEAYVPEYDMQNVALNQEVNITFEAFDETYKGTITKIYPTAETSSSSSTNVVKIEVSVPENVDIKAGYTADLEIITDIDEDATVIPIVSYMTETDSDPYVFVINDKDILEKRNITIKTFENSLVSVEGLLEGEIIVSSPDDSLTEGTKVTKTSTV